MSYTVESSVYTIEQKALDTFRLLAEQRKPTEKLIKILEKMPLILIDNLTTYLHSLLNDQQNILREFDRVECKFSTMDTQDTYRRLLDKIRGCSRVCPCCHRSCDVDHTRIKSQPGSRDNEHRCTTGHALRAMNGYKFEVTDEASLWTCKQIKDDQIVVIGTRRYLWSEFKLNHSHWKFESDLDRLHGKFLFVWQKIGRILCQKYNMKYVTDNVASCYVRQAFHYILILDGSASMHGKRWQDLMKAVQQFLTYRQALQTDDRITIIVFSHNARIVYLDEKIDRIYTNRISHINQQADYTIAFETVKVCIEHSRTKAVHQRNLDYAIIFISNGQAAYPEQELEELSREHRSVINQFWTLSLNDDSESPAAGVLGKINKKMNGSFYDVPASTGLIKAYAEVAGKCIT